MNTIRRISQYVIVCLMLPALVLTGCGMLESDEPRDYLAEGDRPIFKDSPHQSFYQLFGDVTENDIKILLQDILDNVQSATRQGDLAREDSELIIELIYIARDAINSLGEGDNDQKAGNFRDGLAGTMEVMAEKRVGDMATNLLTGWTMDDVDNLIKYRDWESIADPEERAGQKAEYDKGNMLLSNLLPMLEYIANMDFGDFQGIPLAVPEGLDVNVVIDSDDVRKFSVALGHLVNPEGPYKEVYDQTSALFNLARAREASLENRLTVGDARKLMNGLSALLRKFTEGVQGAQGNGDIDVDVASITTAIREALTSLWDINKTDGFTPESISDVVVNLWFDISPESDFNIEAVMDAVLELWEDENAYFKDDTLASIYALGRLMADTTRPGYDGWTWTDRPGMTDMERVLYCVQDLLNPMVQDRASVRNFLLNSLEGAALLEGADNINGMMKGLSAVTLEDMKDIDTALYKYLLQNEINGNSRKAENPGPGETYSQTNMSVTRAILYMMSSIYKISDIIEGPATRGLLSLIEAEPGTLNYPDLPKENLLEWMLGLMIVGMYEYPAVDVDEHDPSNPDDDEIINYLDGYPNPLEGLDWVFYAQDLKPLNWKILKMDGLYGMLGMLLNHPDLFDAIGYAVGGLTDPLPAMIEFVGSEKAANTTGDKHKLFSLVAPILKHYWDQGRILDMVEMTTYINEISMSSYKTLAWAKNDATFNMGRGVDNRLGHVLENIEGLYGRGLMYYSLRGDSEADTDHFGDPLDPILDLAVRVFRKLRNTPYGNASMLDYITAAGSDLSGQVQAPDPAELVNRLFEPNASGESPIDKIYSFLVDNHDALAMNSKAIGEVLLALHDDLKPYIGSEDGSMGPLTGQAIIDILAKEGNFLDVFSSQTQNDEAREALVSMVRYILEDPAVRDAEMVQYIMAVFGIEDDEKVVDTLSNLMDSGLLLLGGIIDDFQILIPYYYDFVTTVNTTLKSDKEEEEKIEEIAGKAKTILNDTVFQDALASVCIISIEEIDRNYGFTDQDFRDKVQTLIKEVMSNTDVLIDDFKEMAPVIIKQLKNVDIPTNTIDTEVVSQGFNKILTTILDEIGKKSTLTDKLKIAGFKSMWLRNAEYNKNGVLTDETLLFEALDFLFTGKDSKYGLGPILKFLDTFTKEDMISTFLSDETDTGYTSSILAGLQERNVKPMISMRLIRSMLTPYDGRLSTVHMLFDILHVHRVEGNTIKTLDVNLLIYDLADIISGFNLNTDGTSRLYNTLYKLINYVADNIEIQ